jgi:uncharacterized phage infection (PIP) family protein YhgE
MMLGAFAARAGISGLQKMGDELDRVGKLAKRFDTSAESVQRLGHAAELNGANFEKLAKGMSNANRMAQEALNGNKRAAASFDAMGVSASEFIGMGLDEQVGALADGFILAEQNVRGLDAGAQVFGVSARELIPLLKQGSAAIKEQGETAGVASNKLVKQAEAFNDAMTNLKSKIFGFFAEFADKIQKVTPMFILFKDVFQNSVTFVIQAAVIQVGQLWEALKKLTGGDFSGAFDSMADGGDKLHAAFKALGDANAGSVDKAFEALRDADIQERVSLRGETSGRKKRKDDQEKAAIDEGKRKTNEKLDDALRKAEVEAAKQAERDQKKRDSEMGSLKKGGVESGVISSSLRSIGGGGSAVVTRDPALQIAKRSERILELIAANTAAARDDNEGKGGQKEF